MPKLWTIQGIGFNIRSDRVDWKKSKYYSNSHYPGIPAAYEELKDRLGTGDFLWTSNDPNTFRTPEKKVACWCLDVPDNRILAVVHAMYWNRRIGLKPGIPGNAREIEMSYAMLHEIDPYERLAELEHKFKHSPEPADGWLSVIMLSDSNDPYANPLIPCPVDPAWVVKVVDSQNRSVDFITGLPL